MFGRKSEAPNNFELADVLDALRSNLVRAEERARAHAQDDQVVGLRLDKAKVELDVTVSVSRGGSGTIGFQVLGATLGASLSRNHNRIGVHRITLDLVPGDPNAPGGLLAGAPPS